MPPEQLPSDRVPPELDPWFERYDDDRPPRTMARRFRPLILVAAALTHPLVALGLLAGVPLLVGVTRWYLRRAAPVYNARADARSWAAMQAFLSEACA